jgi:hypothetical protein
MEQTEIDSKDHQKNRTKYPRMTSAMSMSSEAGGGGGGDDAAVAAYEEASVTVVVGVVRGAGGGRESAAAGAVSPAIPLGEVLVVVIVMEVPKVGMRVGCERCLPFHRLHKTTTCQNQICVDLGLLKPDSSMGQFFCCSSQNPVAPYIQSSKQQVGKDIFFFRLPDFLPQKVSWLSFDFPKNIVPVYLL